MIGQSQTTISTYSHDFIVIGSQVSQEYGETVMGTDSKWAFRLLSDFESVFYL